MGIVTAGKLSQQKWIAAGFLSHFRGTLADQSTIFTDQVNDEIDTLRLAQRLKLTIELWQVMHELFPADVPRLEKIARFGFIASIGS